MQQQNQNAECGELVLQLGLRIKISDLKFQLNKFASENDLKLKIDVC